MQNPNWRQQRVLGGRVANIGVHGEPATLHLEDLWIRDVTITTGLVDTYSTPTLNMPEKDFILRARPVFAKTLGTTRLKMSNLLTMHTHARIFSERRL